MVRLAIVSAVALVSLGCVAIPGDECANGTICPPPLVCDNAHGGCVVPEQVSDCLDKAQFDGCSYPAEPNGTCDDGICVPAGCGNNLLEPLEVCDDGNTDDGDGCSSTCASLETCGNSAIDAFLGEGCDDGNAIRHDGCAANCASEPPLWTDLSSGTPPARNFQRLVYDRGRDRVVLFGGVNSSGELGDTWEWDGVAWHQARPPQPRPVERIRHAMFYDPTRRRVVLFGGQTLTGGLLNDTWEWDGVRWTRLEPTASPPPMAGHQIVYETPRDRAVLHGGFDALFVQQDWTWTWDGTTWTQLTVAQPAPAVASHSMTYDPRRDRVVLFTAGETWEWDGVAWTALAPATSPPTTPAAARLVYETRRQMSLFLAATTPTSMWGWDGTNWQELALATIPPPRTDSDWAHNPVTGETVLFGDGTATADTWVLTDSDWTDRTVNVGPSGAFASTYDSRRGVLVGFQGDLAFEWAGSWTSPPQSVRPPLRVATSLIYQPNRSATLLFGGRPPGGGQVPIQDTWEWDGTTWSLRSPDVSPPPRLQTMLAFDDARSRVVMFGGSGQTTNNFGDTWEWDGDNWTESSTPIAPSARRDAGFAFDKKRGVTVLFGGRDDNGATADTWEWNGSEWTELSPTVSPPARSLASLTYNPIRSVVVMVAGADSNGVLTNDIWEFDGTTWTTVVPDTELPPRRSAHASAYVTTRGGVVISGGLTGTQQLEDGWIYRYDSGAPFESCSFGFDVDGDGLSGCDDSDCWSTCQPLCPPGLPCAADAPRCGDNTCDLAENCRSCATDCGACTPICGDTLCDPMETDCPGDCS